MSGGVLKGWYLGRVTFPAVLGCLLFCVLRNGDYHLLFNTMILSLFILHLLVTYIYKNNHLLDTVSYFFLLIAVISFLIYRDQMKQFDSTESGFKISLVSLAFYLGSSLLGRFRAVLPGEDRSTLSRKTILSVLGGSIPLILVITFMDDNLVILLLIPVLFISGVIFIAFLKQE